jgi:hypothetical protein
MTLTADIQWWPRRLWRLLGAPGLVGLVLTLLAPLILLGGILPLQNKVASLRQELTQKPAQPVRATPVIPPEKALTAELATFEERFPTVDQLSDQLDILFELAKKHGLLVDKGEYTLIERAGGAMRRFEVTLPVTGTYPQIRTLLLDALHKLPAAALSDVTLEREKIADSRAKATLRFVVFVRRNH